MKNRIAEFGKISRCALLSLVVTVILCGIFAFCVHLWQIEESTARTIVFAIVIVSLIFGGFVLAKNIGHSGLLNGLLMSVIYFFALLLLSLITGGGSFSGAADVTRFVTIIASGMLGGILGVNT